MEHEETKLKQRLYDMFRPEIEVMHASALLRLPDLKVAPYHKNLGHIIAAAAVYGVARRANLEITPIQENSSEEFNLRKALRGKFFDSEITKLAETPLDEVYEELKEQGFSREQIDASSQRLRETAEFYGSLMDQDQADEEPVSEQSPDKTKVTRIDALFKIASNANPNVGTYCRAWFPQGHANAMFYWDNQDFTQQPYDQMDYAVEFDLVDDGETYDTFLTVVVSDILALKGDGEDDHEDNIDAMITRLEYELDARK